MHFSCSQVNNRAGSVWLHAQEFNLERLNTTALDIQTSLWDLLFLHLAIYSFTRICQRSQGFLSRCIQYLLSLLMDMAKWSQMTLESFHSSSLSSNKWNCECPSSLKILRAALKWMYVGIFWAATEYSAIDVNLLKAWRWSSACHSNGNGYHSVSWIAKTYKKKRATQGPNFGVVHITSGSL